MAVSLNRFVVTATTTVPASAGTAAAYGTETFATGGGTTYGGPQPTTFQEGTVLLLDSGTPDDLYATLNGLGVLRAWTQNDVIGHAALTN